VQPRFSLTKLVLGALNHARYLRACTSCVFELLLLLNACLHSSLQQEERAVEDAPTGAELMRDFELTQVAGDSLLAVLGGKESTVAVKRCTVPIKSTQYGHPGINTRFYDEKGIRKFKCDDYHCTTRWGADVKVSIRGTHVGDGRGGLGSNAVLNVDLMPVPPADSQATAGGRSQQQVAAPRRMLNSRLSGPPKHVRTLAERLATAAKRAMVNATAATAASSSSTAALFGGQRQAAPLVTGTDDSSETEAAAARLRADGQAALAATVAAAVAADEHRSTAMESH
jgi:hypothetical protein